MRYILLSCLFILAACDSTNVLYNEIISLDKGTSQKAYKFSLDRTRLASLEIKAEPHSVNAYIVYQGEVESFFKLRSFRHIEPFRLKSAIDSQVSETLNKGDYALIVGHADINQTDSTKVKVKLTFSNP